MSYSITFDYSKMIGTVEMKKEDGGIALTLTASAPAKKSSHFIIPGTDTVVEGATMSAVAAALQTSLFWRILAVNGIMETYKVEIDFTGEHPKVELWRGVAKPAPSRVEYVQLLGYQFTDPSEAQFKLSKKGLDMHIMQKK